MLTISIIIPVRNRKHFTQSILTQLQIQIAQNSRIDTQILVIVVDDGSTDGTPELILEKFSDVHLIQGDGSLWWGGAIVKGMELALQGLQADYIVWLNDDLSIAENLVNNLINICCSNFYQETIVGGIVRDKTHPEWIVYGGLQKNQAIKSMNAFATSEDLEVDVVFGNMTVIPRPIIEKIGMPDAAWLPHNGCDHEYTLRAKKQGFRVILSAKLQGMNDYTVEDVIRYMPYWMQWYLQTSLLKKYQIFKGLTNLKTGYNIWVVIKMHSKHRDSRSIYPWQYALCYISKVLKLWVIDFMPKKQIAARIHHYLMSQSVPIDIINQIMVIKDLKSSLL